jgi:hypothetical protein
MSDEATNVLLGYGILLLALMGYVIFVLEIAMNATGSQADTTRVSIAWIVGVLTGTVITLTLMTSRY